MRHDIANGKPWLLSLETIRAWGSYLSHDLEHDGRHRISSIDNWRWGDMTKPCTCGGPRCRIPIYRINKGHNPIEEQR